MVGPNCRVHITTHNAKRGGGQGVNLALLQSPLERYISESQTPQLCKAPESTRGDPNTITVAEHCFREDLLVTPLPPWRKTSGAGGGPKGQGNAELLPCNEPCWEVTPGTLSRLPKLASVE